jgi:hypothetical protein
MTFDLNSIDEHETYTAAALARLAGVTPNTAIRWIAQHQLKPVPSIGFYKQYSGADIRAVFAAEGHLPPVCESQREGLRTLRTSKKQAVA